MATDRTAGLYGLPLAGFTLARDALAKELAEGGDRAAAAEVRALKKPSVSTWAVNQVARAHGGDVEALFDAGSRLRDAQKKLIRVGDPAAVKDATAAERQAVRSLVDHAKEILTRAGHTPNEAMLERIADTFYATTVDEEGRELVRSGVLTKELKRAGFGDIGGLSVVPARGPGEKPKKVNARLGKKVADLQAAADEAESRAEGAEREAGDLAKAAEDARARADAAREKARFARRQATERRREAEKAARRLDRQG